jgi:hypothetical protein
LTIRVSRVGHFFVNEACFHLSSYINSQNNGVCTAWKSTEFANCLEKELWGHCSLKRQLLPKIIQIFLPNSLISWDRINGIVSWKWDWAVAHTAKTTAVLLQDIFRDRNGGRGIWRPRSRDRFVCWSPVKRVGISCRKSVWTWPKKRGGS